MRRNGIGDGVKEPKADVMVHSSSKSPMTTPSASLHLTVSSKAPLSVSVSRGATEQNPSQTSPDPTSHSELSQSLVRTPGDARRHVAIAAKALSAKLSSASGSPYAPTPASAQDQVNGRRSGRKRTPKACDCCGPNNRGHHVETSGRGRGRGRGKGRGASRDLGDTPARKPSQFTAIRNFNLSAENIQETEDEDDKLGNLHNSLLVADTQSQSPATEAAPAVTQDGPKNRSPTQTNGAALEKRDVLMEPSSLAVAAQSEGDDKQEVDPTVLGPAHREPIVARGRGAGMGRGRGRGRGTGRGRAKMGGINQMSSKDKCHVTSLRTGISAESMLAEEPEKTQDIKTDHEHQNNSASGKLPSGNGELVHLSDSEDKMEEDTIIVAELEDGVLTTLQKSATRLETSDDLDSEMQVDQMHDGIEQSSLSVPLPNGNVPSPRNHDQASSSVEGKTSSSAVLASLNPIAVSLENSWALRDHRLYCQPCSWVKDEMVEMLLKEQAENKLMDTDTQKQESLEQLKDIIDGKTWFLTL